MTNHQSESDPAAMADHSHVGAWTLAALRLRNPGLAQRVTAALEAAASPARPNPRHPCGPTKHPLERAVDLLEIAAQGDRPTLEQLGDLRSGWSDCPQEELARDVLAEEILLGRQPLPTSHAELDAAVRLMLRDSGLAVEWPSTLERSAAEKRLRAALPAPPVRRRDDVTVTVCPDGLTDEKGEPRTNGSLKCEIQPLYGDSVTTWLRRGTVTALAAIAQHHRQKWPKLKSDDKRPQRLVELLERLGLKADIEGRGRKRVVVCNGPLRVRWLRDPMDPQLATKRALVRGDFAMKAQGQ